MNKDTLEKVKRMLWLLNNRDNDDLALAELINIVHSLEHDLLPDIDDAPSEIMVKES